MAKEITRAEVAKHNTQEDCWMIIENAVYDVTKFLIEHPGGEEVMLDVAGMDATTNFEDVGHSMDAREDLANYKIGVLPQSECEEVAPAPVQNHQPPAQKGSSTWLYVAAVGVALAAYYFTKSS
eukprot:m.353148 g.353148  ORF g.353148 m.353148 type:complete len:124 (-) comp16692_c0_seq1:424-795(-)